ncbi:MAG: acyl-CoA synthetase [Pseudomonadota bacterium]
MPDDQAQEPLPPNAANHAALTPLDFLERAAEIYPDRTAILHGPIARSWQETLERCRRLGSALRKRGVGRDKTVAVLAPNTPPIYEAHFGVPLAGAVLNAINTRLDAATIAFILEHGEAEVFLVDPGLVEVAEIALAESSRKPLVVALDDPFVAMTEGFGDLTYEELLAEGDPDDRGVWPEDEWQAICLNYTSGTTGNPKGVVYHHRGAALLALGNVMTWDMPPHAIYLWTLPMFHCNGWCFPWTITALAGTHVCLRAVDPAEIYRLIAETGVTHLCGAPIVMQMLMNAGEEQRRDFGGRLVEFMTAGAAPPAAILERMTSFGFRVTHVYGLTEVYGPAVVCDWKPEWNGLSSDEQARIKARQGVTYPVLDGLMVADAESLAPLPKDGESLGEVMMRGNVIMKGYLKNPTATAEAFAGGWFHTGDLGVWHPDGYVELKDRSKDIIISGGENISSIEVEGALYRHPAVAACAVVAKPDERWGETPFAFVELRPGTNATAEELTEHCRSHLARFKVPKGFAFREVPKTSTGKIQKFALREEMKSGG